MVRLNVYSRLNAVLMILIAIPIFAQTPRLFWAYQADYVGKVQSAGIDGANVTDVATEKEQPFGLAVDWQSNPQKVYFCERNANRIIRTNLDGSNPEEIITEIAGIRDLELDVLNRKIYWITDTYDDDAIQRANMDSLNSQIEVIYSNNKAFVGSHGLALDHVHHKIYWVEGDNGCGDKIRRINFDKTGLETIIYHPNDGLLWPWDIDVVGDKIYWIDGGEDILYKANLDGSQTDSVMAGVDGEYFVIDSSASAIYIAERGKITRANIDGSAREDLITGLGYFLMGIDIAYHVPTAISEKDRVITDFALYQNYPNPFNPSTSVSFFMKDAGQANLTVYDINGKLVKVLENGLLVPGLKTLHWDATDRFGKIVAPGLYFYSLKTRDFSRTKKMILIK